MIGTLYRAAAHNEHGDSVDQDGNAVRLGSDGTVVGTITGLVMGGPNWRPANARGDVVDTTGLVGVPASEVAQPTHGDLLVVDGVRFSVRGPAAWTHANTLTGTPPRYRWWTVTAAAN